MDQINTLRIILEQSNEWCSALHLIFVDYTSAFDSVTRSSIWDALQRRGISSKAINLIKAQYNGFKCRVIHNGQLSETFNSSSGVRQGCLISPILFLIVLDDVIHLAFDSKPRGIRWNLSEYLEDLDYADDVSLLSSKETDMQNKLNDLVKESEKVGLKINPTKTKCLKVRTKNSNNCYKLESESIENVENFTYLGSVITSDGGAKEDILSRISKAKGAFAQLNKIWNSSFISTRTKIRFFNSNVKSVLFYGCETWLVTEDLSNKMQVFVNKCLRRILQIWWPNTISNDELHTKCNQCPVAIEIKRRKWNWIGHTLRKPSTEPCRQALDWNPQGSRRQGRPKMTWRRSIDVEVKSTGFSWKEIKMLARNRDRWRNFVNALCSTGNERN